MKQAGAAHTTSTYMNTPQAVWIHGNAYAGLSAPFRGESGWVRIDGAEAKLKEQAGQWVLTLRIPADISNASCLPVTTQRLGAPRITEQPYDDPAGDPVDLTRDYFGDLWEEAPIPGPFSKLSSGEHHFVVWKA